MQNSLCAVPLLSLVKSAKLYVCCAIIKSCKECKVQLLGGVKSAKFYVCCGIIRCYNEGKILCVLCSYYVL